MEADSNAIGKFQRGSTTQREAAILAYPASGTQRYRVLQTVIASDNGLTDEEMQFALGMNPSTQRPRRVELVDGGFIIDSHQRRKTRSGRTAIVWIAKPKPTLF